MIIRNYTVYMHIFPNKKKYIGITNRDVDERWASGNGYRRQFVYRAILKYGWNNIEHKILFSELSKEEAERIEIELINKYNTTNRAIGYNIESGGKSSDRLTPELKERISKKLKGVPKGEANIKKYKEVWAARPNAEKDRLKNICSMEVLKCSLNGDIIEKYRSTREAARMTGVSCSHISECCNKKRKSIGGYIWKYAS